MRRAQPRARQAGEGHGTVTSGRAAARRRREGAGALIRGAVAGSGPAPTIALVPPAEPDHRLVERALRGERAAFDVLAERYYRMISVLAYQKTGHRTDAEDIVQEALVRAFRALTTLRDPERFAAWLYNITLKLCIDAIRRRERRDGTVPFDEGAVGRVVQSGRFTAPVSEVEDQVESEEDLAQVLDAVADLPDKYRLILTLRYVRKLSYKEIAEHLCEPPGTIANRLHRATRLLRDRLGIDERRRARGPSLRVEEEL